MKVKCARCKKIKDSSEFWKNSSRENGLNYCCKECLREYRQKNIEAYRETDKIGKRKYRKKHPELWIVNNKKYRKPAHDLVWRAVKDGKLKRKNCEIKDCGKRKVHAHHDDYSKPLEVRWLCPAHHKQLHRDKRAQGRSNKIKNK